jgi:putative DNA primase/helicase
MQAFFEKLFSGFFRGHPGFIEIRAWASEDAIKHRRFCNRIVSAAHTVEYFRRHPDKLNIYFGVAPRSERGGRKEHVQFATCLWADLDGKMFGSKSEALQSLQGFELTPSLVVDSGNGYHAYWLLDKPTSEVARVEALNLGIAQALGGDRTYDVTRILRVPGTTNWKDPTNPKPVRLIQSRNRVYSLDDFAPYQVAIARPEALPSVCLDAVEPVNWNEMEEDLDEKYIRWIRYGISGDRERQFDGDRSRLDMTVVCKLVDIGLSDGQIIGILTDPALGISEKTLDKRGEARRLYLEKTLSKAKRFVMGA